MDVISGYVSDSAWDLVSHTITQASQLRFRSNWFIVRSSTRVFVGGVIFNSSLVLLICTQD